jgi:dihydroorotase
MNEGALSNELGIRGNPAAAEEIMVAREIALCRLTRARVHIAHVSTAVALEHIRRARDAGLPVTAEVCPHHLTLTEEAVKTYDTCCKMAPPLRTEQDVEALKKALKEGLIDVIATDHAPHGIVDKAVEFDQAANGIIGVQTAVSLTFKLVDDGMLPLARWVESLTAAPARVLGLPLGTLQTGRDADVTVFDPGAKWVFSEDQVLSKSANSPFLNWELKGKVAATIVGGRIAYEN